MTAPPRKGSKAAAADRMRAALNKGPTPEPVQEPTPEPVRPARPAAARPLAEPVRTDPVRTTIDLSPIEHRTLGDVRARLATLLGRHKVTAADVYRVLIDELSADLEDPREGGLTDRVLQGLRDRAAR